MDKNVQKYKNINYYNYYKLKDIKNYWFTRFVEKYFPDSEFTFNFYSVFGENLNIEHNNKNINIFFSGENLNPNGKKIKSGILSRFYWMNRKRISLYRNYCLDKIDLSMGFDEVDSDKYLRFPLWIMYMFDPDDEKQDILNKIKSINSNNKIPSIDAITVVSSHDSFGTRGVIYDDLKTKFNIISVGKWKKNSDILKTNYADNKINFMSDFKFNICAENINVKNYCTEKIFETLKSGSIPIYLGADGEPEMNLINQNAIIVWHTDKDNQANFDLISKLMDDENYYKEFLSQNRLNEKEMLDYVMSRYMLLYSKIEKVMKDKELYNAEL